MSSRPTFPELVESLKKAAGALRDAGITFMLGGGIACAARGGPETDHDVDQGMGRRRLRRSHLLDRGG